jgi:enoyl-CoA hydratase
MPPPILLTRPSPHLALMTIDRPERRNAFDGETARAMEAAIDAYDADRDLRCAIVTGAGGVFCAGQDLIAAAAGDFALTTRRGGFGVIHQPPAKPLIAAVEGYALGGGLELCLACDMIVASSTATLGLPESTRSLVATGGGLVRLPRRVPFHIAMELAVTGRPMSGTRLHALGLVNRLAEPGRALDAAYELAEAVIAAAPLAAAAAKRILRESADWTEEDAWSKQQEIAAPVFDSADLREGLAAFAEKRPPRWSGN